jgi:hypothetical protein
MPAAGTNLRVVHLEGDREAPPTEHVDLGLTAMIFAVALAPLALDAAGLGRWDGTTLGLGTLGILFSGRELARCVAGGRRGRRS